MIFLKYILTSEILVPGVFCNLIILSNYKKLLKTERLVAAIVFFNVLVEFIASYLGFHEKHNQWLYNVALFPDFILYSSFYYKLITKEKIKRIIIIISSVLILLHIVNILFGQGFELYNSHTGIPINIFTVVMSYLYMKQCVEHFDENPFRNFIFWFAMATLIDLAGTIPVMATLSWLAYTATDVSGKLYIIITVLYILWLTLISTGLIWTKRIMRSASLS